MYRHSDNQTSKQTHTRRGKKAGPSQLNSTFLPSPLLPVRHRHPPRPHQRGPDAAREAVGLPLPSQGHGLPGSRDLGSRHRIYHRSVLSCLRMHDFFSFFLCVSPLLNLCLKPIFRRGFMFPYAVGSFIIAISRFSHSSNTKLHKDNKK